MPFLLYIDERRKYHFLSCKKCYLLELVSIFLARLTFVTKSTTFDLIVRVRYDPLSAQFVCDRSWTRYDIIAA